MSNPTKYRDRKYVAIIYPENEAHAACMEKLKSNGYNFAAILHDKDVYEDGEKAGQTKKAHWHIVLRFKNAVWNTAVAKELGIEPNYLEQCRDVDAALLYLVHYGNEKKHQYDYEEVFGPLRLKLATLLADTDEGTRALNIADIIDNSPGMIGYSELIRKCVAAGLYADLRRMGAFAVGLMREHNDQIWAETKARDAMAADRERQADYMRDHGEVPFSRLIDALDHSGMLPGDIKPL